ncbi:MAG: ABC transporter substrate-binding protein, partial [Deltaproteobacteria bacterium]|nr:ABC transporter substrate-binding protein [Deltaproteobacteria bacterium]
EVVVTPTPVPEMKPVSGGTLTYAIRREPRMLDPVLATGWDFTHTASHIYDALLCSDEKGNLYPALAESWEISDDGLHYTFHLRKGVKFHDGTPFNAEAVKFYLDHVKDPEWCCGNAYEYVGPYESSEVLDEYTVRVNFKEPWGPFLTYAADWYTMSIVSPAAVKKWGKDILMHPVGTGPFRFVEWVPQSHVTLERNPDYNWAPEIRGHQGPAYLDKIIIKFISEPATLLACLKSGECDIIRDPAFPDIKGIRADPNFEVVKIPQKGSPLSWNFNTVRPPTDDLQVRKALNFAVDRHRIAEMVFANERAPMYTALSPETPEYWPGAADYIHYDPEGAKAILERAGWVDTNGDGIREKGGQRLTIDFYVFGAAEANPYVTL